MRKKIITIFLLVTMGILYLKVISPTFNIHIPCLFNKITGFDCPGCGMTRASLAVLDGNFYQAFRWNMLVFILAPLYLLYLFLQKMQYVKQSKVTMFSMLLLTLLFFILRNTETFEWMAPTKV